MRAFVLGYRGHIYVRRQHALGEIVDALRPLTMMHHQVAASEEDLKRHRRFRGFTPAKLHPLTVVLAREMARGERALLPDRAENALHEGCHDVRMFALHPRRRAVAAVIEPPVRHRQDRMDAMEGFDERPLLIERP